MSTPEELLAGKIAGFLDRYFAQRPDVLKALQQQHQAMPHPSPGSPTAAASEVKAKPKTEEDLSAMLPEEREQYWRDEFNRSSELKQEFMEFGIYHAFKANEYRTRTLRGPVTQ